MLITVELKICLRFDILIIKEKQQLYYEIPRLGDFEQIK